MHHPPPVVLVEHQVGRVVEGEQEEHGQAGEADQQHQAHNRLAALEDGQRDVEQEGQRHDHDPDLGDRGLLEELPAHGGQQLVLRQLRQARVGHQQIARHRQSGRDQEDPEHGDREPGRGELTLRLLRHQVVGGTHEGHQQPHDERVGMHHASDVERDLREQEIADDVLQAHDEPEQDLRQKQGDGRDEVGLGDGLGLVFHLISLRYAAIQPWTFGGQPAVSISELYLRNSAIASSSSSLKLNWGMLRRPGTPSAGRLWIKALIASLLWPKRT